MASFPEAVLARAVALGSRTAILDTASGRSLSYEALRRQAGAVGSALVKRGFGRGHILTLFGANCPENAVLSLGAMAAGGTLHFVRPDVNADQLRQRLDVTRPRVLVVTAERAGLGAAAAAECPSRPELFVVDAVGYGSNRFIATGGGPGRPATELLEDDGEADPLTRESPLAAGDDLALLLETGGTSGRARMVMITHENLLRVTAESEIRLCGKVTFTPFSYISSVIFAYGQGLRDGVTVVSLAQLEPNALVRVVEEHRLTSLGLTPASAIALVHCPAFDNADLSSLETVQWGGAPISARTEEDVTSRFRTKAPGIVFLQCYGMTEITGAATVCLPSSLPGPDKAGTVGLPLPHVEMRVVSCVDGATLCGPNEPGEIFIKSPTVMKGYFKDEEATRRVLTADGWYHTGDYGWRDSDGYYFVVDRIDDLINSRHGLIVPSVIEAVVRSHPRVLECIVVADKKEGDAFPVAFVVPEGEVSAAELEHFVAERVEPCQQLRGGVRFIERIPKSLAGKLLRRVLTEQL